MATFERRRWLPESDLSGLSRRDRRICDYEVYLADPLVGRAFTFAGSVSADVSDAERAIVRLNESARTLVDTEALARLLLRAESVASSRIEGLEVGARRLLRADVQRQLGEAASDVTATEVLANIDAMTFGTQAIREGDTITIELLLELHRRLLAPTHFSRYAGKVRTVQNWIGGSSYNPCEAAFVPPPPELVPSMLEDLCAFCNDASLPAIAQAAIAHAQFETIHPFVDGNGRVGRALIHLVLRQRGLATRTLPPISLILATHAAAYVNGLRATRYQGTPYSAAAREGYDVWVAQFAAAASRAVADTDAFERRIDGLEKDWRKRLGSVRSRSAVDVLLRSLPGVPVLTVQGAAQIVGRSFESANNAVARLVDAGILTPIRAGARNRAFEAPEVVAAFTDFERQLASPDADSNIAPPARRVPRGKRARYVDRPGSANVFKSAKKRLT